MSRRRLAFASIAVVTVLCIVGVSIAAVAAGGSAMAYSVNGTRVSQQTVDDELDWLSGNKAYEQSIKQQGGTLSVSDGSISSAISANWLNQRIQAQLLREGAARTGVKVPAATLDEVRKQLEQRYPKAPSSVIDVLVDTSGETYVAALGLDSAEKQAAFFTPLVRRADVQVDPKYGTWRGLRGLCPPTGCPTTG
jgi:hypothetical protein